MVEDMIDSLEIMKLTAEEEEVIEIGQIDWDWELQLKPHW